jgi:rhodanese-related sulfurtransferase
MLIKKLKARHDALANTKLPPEAVAKLIKAGAFLVDVRPKIQVMMGMAPGATSISLFTLKRRLHELPRNRKIVFYCHSGAAAAKAKQILDARGFKAFNGGGYKDVMKVVRAIGSTRAAPAGRRK